MKPARTTDAFIAGYLLLQAVLIVTCYARPAKFFGWQMFSFATAYRTRFAATGPDGAMQPLPREAYQPWITGRARLLITPTDSYRIYNRGQEFLLGQISRVPGFLCGKLAPQGYRAVEVTVEYQDASAPAISRETFRAACAADERA